MNLLKITFCWITLILIAGCGSVASSSVPHLPVAQHTNEPIFVTTSDLPEHIEYEVVGTVKANARQGYGAVENLYPLLALEAKKIGANAVINVYGFRSVSAFSWAAPYTGGTAVRIKNVDDLDKASGKFF